MSEQEKPMLRGETLEGTVKNIRDGVKDSEGKSVNVGIFGGKVVGGRHEQVRSAIINTDHSKLSPENQIKFGNMVEAFVGMCEQIMAMEEQLGEMSLGARAFPLLSGKAYNMTPRQVEEELEEIGATLAEKTDGNTRVTPDSIQPDFGKPEKAPDELGG